MIRPTLDTFTRAYIECALWSSTDNADDSGGEPLDRNYDESDITDESLAKMVEDCRRFRAMTAPDGRSADAMIPDDEQGGHDFWLTRNGHGAGFWDREHIYGKSAARYLIDLSKEMGECDLIVGDDGEIHAVGGR